MCFEVKQQKPFTHLCMIALQSCFHIHMILCSLKTFRTIIFRDILAAHCSGILIQTWKLKLDLRTKSVRRPTSSNTPPSSNFVLRLLTVTPLHLRGVRSFLTERNISLTPVRQSCTPPWCILSASSCFCLFCTEILLFFCRWLSQVCPFRNLQLFCAVCSSSSKCLFIPSHIWHVTLCLISARAWPRD